MIKPLYAMPHTPLQGAGRKEGQGSLSGMISTKPPPIPGHAMQQKPLQQKPPRVNTHIPIRIRSTSIRTAWWPIKLPPVDTFPSWCWSPAGEERAFYMTAYCTEESVLRRRTVRWILGAYLWPCDLVCRPIALGLFFGMSNLPGLLTLLLENFLPEISSALVAEDADDDIISSYKSA